jgi:hypothetical protein
MIKDLDALRRDRCGRGGPAWTDDVWAAATPMRGPPTPGRLGYQPDLDHEAVRTVLAPPETLLREL